MILAIAVLAAWSTHTSGQTAMKIDKALAEQMTASRDAAERFAVIVTLNKAEDLARMQERGIKPSLAGCGKTPERSLFPEFLAAGAG